MKKLKIMAIGAHPDDCEGSFGGTALKYVQNGCSVEFVSTTDGSAGHQSMGRAELAGVRREEAHRAALTAGVTSIVLDNPDAMLEPTLAVREKLLSLIRAFSPDLIFTHRPNDYHPDHRATALLVQDSSYLVMVPNACPKVPALRFQPAIFYFSDSFRHPYPFEPDVVVRIDDVFERKLDVVSCHRSQYSDFLPWMARIQKEIPNDFDNSTYARRCVAGDGADTAKRFHDLLEKRYGASVRYAEAFEMSEYGAQIDPADFEEYFPR